MPACRCLFSFFSTPRCDAPSATFFVAFKTTIHHFDANIGLNFIPQIVNEFGPDDAVARASSVGIVRREQPHPLGIDTIVLLQREIAGMCVDRCEDRVVAIAAYAITT